MYYIIMYTTMFIKTAEVTYVSALPIATTASLNLSISDKRAWKRGYRSTAVFCSALQLGPSRQRGSFPWPATFRGEGALSSLKKC